MKKLRFFFKYYGSNRIIGGRVSEKSLSYIIKDKDERNEFLSTFFEWCPPMPWLGESEDYDMHYLLKPKWEILRYTYNFISIARAKPLKFFKYFRWWIGDLMSIKKDQEYYMNPTSNIIK